MTTATHTPAPAAFLHGELLDLACSMVDLHDKKGLVLTSDMERLGDLLDAIMDNMEAPFTNTDASPELIAELAMIDASGATNDSPRLGMAGAVEAYEIVRRALQGASK